MIAMSLCRARAWKTNLLLVAQAVLFIALTWGVDRAGERGFSCTCAGTHMLQQQGVPACCVCCPTQLPSCRA